MLEQFVTHVHDHLKDQYGIDIDWESLLELLVEVIEFCLENLDDIINIFNTPTILQKAAFAVLIRRRLNVFGIKKVRKIRDCVFDCAKEMYEDETKGEDYVKGVLYEVKSLFHPRYS